MNKNLIYFGVGVAAYLLYRNYKKNQAAVAPADVLTTAAVATAPVAIGTSADTGSPIVLVPVLPKGTITPLPPIVFDVAAQTTAPTATDVLQTIPVIKFAQMDCLVAPCGGQVPVTA